VYMYACGCMHLLMGMRLAPHRVNVWEGTMYVCMNVCMCTEGARRLHPKLYINGTLAQPFSAYIYIHTYTHGVRSVHPKGAAIHQRHSPTASGVLTYINTNAHTHTHTYIHRRCAIGTSKRCSHTSTAQSRSL
jgi:hypothetical protein